MFGSESGGQKPAGRPAYIPCAVYVSSLDAYIAQEIISEGLRVLFLVHGPPNVTSMMDMGVHM